MADKWTAPRPDADEVPYWGVNDSFEEEGDDADADLDADGRKKLTVRQQCLRLGQFSSPRVHHRCFLY